MHPLLVALQFLTRIPVPFAGPPEAAQIRRSLAYYPVVGAILGTVLWLGSGLLTDIGPVLHAALLLSLWVVLTGALHLDGLADTADASAGQRGDPARARALLKDPRCGPMGAVALILVLLVKFAALAELAASAAAWVLWLPPVLARAAVVGLFVTTSYVSPGGLGTHLAGPQSRARNLVSVAVAVLFTWLVAGTAATGWAVLTATLSFTAVRAWLRRTFGGLAGDGAGALVEITETATLVVLVTVAI